MERSVWKGGGKGIKGECGALRREPGTNEGPENRMRSTAAAQRLPRSSSPAKHCNSRRETINSRSHTLGRVSDCDWFRRSLRREFCD